MFRAHWREYAWDNVSDVSQAQGVRVCQPPKVVSAPVTDRKTNDVQLSTLSTNVLNESTSNFKIEEPQSRDLDRAASYRNTEERQDAKLTSPSFRNGQWCC